MRNLQTQLYNLACSAHKHNKKERNTVPASCYWSDWSAENDFVNSQMWTKVCLFETSKTTATLFSTWISNLAKHFALFKSINTFIKQKTRWRNNLVFSRYGFASTDSSKSRLIELIYGWIGDSLRHDEDALEAIINQVNDHVRDAL